MDAVVVAYSPAVIADVAVDRVNVSEEATIADDEGAEDRNPSPSVVTTTSAKRLKVSFDIIFLSLVVSETFSNTAGKEILAL